MDERTVREERARRTRSHLERIEDIPTLPPVLVRVWELTGRQDTSARELAKAISLDPGLTGALLRLANSAYFGFPQKIATVTQAVVVLGFDTVKSLAMGASVFRAIGSKGGFLDLREFWHHSLMVAFSAKLLMERRHPQRSGAAFCGGILHDLGKLVQAEFLPTSLAAVREHLDAGLALEDAELEVLGLTHAEIGEWFAREWSFPPELAAAVHWHHQPIAAREHLDYVAAVHLGDVLAHRAGATGNGRPVPPEPSEVALQEFQLSETDLAPLLERVLEMTVDAGMAGAALEV